ncbi:sodium-dependent transporter [Acidobacteria bacterium AH-259-A15]|nr:sodium-dependent transporter [Acidobacteria bacterium AH-259-A15]
MSAKEQFTSRWGLIMSVIGIAVGTGNIWRFPRIAAANGGGAFLLPWIIFLFLWSIPLIMTEFAMGKLTRYGTIGSFAVVMGKRFAWMGSFVGFVATAIMFYYSVVAGWCIRYLFLAGTGQLLQATDHEITWTTFVESGWQPILFHFIAISIGAFVVQRGVVNGIEKANRFLIPVLLGVIIVSAIRAVTLPGASQGLAYLFTPDFNALLDYRVWLQALTQNAWDTGAGWGLILTYSVYMREREDVPLNAALIGLGNNSVSLLAAITVFSTAFAMIPDQAAEVIGRPGPANTGLTFIWIPRLFAQMPGGTLFSAFFFLALTFAALSSLISMIELSTRILMDMKMARRSALLTVYTTTLVLGIPSALSLDFFLNQDWTWGIALMVSGAFIAIAVLKFGVERFRTTQINSSGSDIQIGRWYDHLIRYAIPAQVIILITWWFTQVIQADPDNWWKFFATESVGTCLLQWSLAILAFVTFNHIIAERTLQK